MMMEVRAQSTLPADFICCQTLVSGDVQLTWGASAEACGSFVEYQIFASSVSAAGPYGAPLAIIPGIGTTTFTHIGANGTVTTWYYYIVAVHLCRFYHDEFRYFG